MESIDAILSVFITVVFVAAAIMSAFITSFFLSAKATAASTVTAISLQQQQQMESFAVIMSAFLLTALIFVFFASFLLYAKETAASTVTVPPSTTTTSTTTNQQPPPAPTTPFGVVTANLNVPLPSLSPYSSLIPLLTQLDSHNLAVAAQSISSPFVASWPGPYTIFAPTDSSLRTCPTCSPSLLLQERSVPRLYTAEYLSLLALGTKIETVLPGRCLTVTSSGIIYKIFVGGAEIMRPDLVDDGRVVVHGIQGFLSHLSPYSCSIDKMTSLSVPRPSPSITTMRLMLTDAMARLRTSGYSVLALALRVKYPELVVMENMTVFALDDAVIFDAGPPYVGREVPHSAESKADDGGSGETPGLDGDSDAPERRIAGGDHREWGRDLGADAAQLREDQDPGSDQQSQDRRSRIGRSVSSSSTEPRWCHRKYSLLGRAYHPSNALKQTDTSCYKQYPKSRTQRNYP